MSGRLKFAVLKRFLRSEPGAVLLWVLCSLILAAALTPWAYQAGKWLAELSKQEQLPAIIQSVAGSCGRAGIGRFFDRSLLFSALLLLPLLLRWIKHHATPSRFRGADLRHSWHWKSAFVQIICGFLVAGGLLWALGALLDFAGAYNVKGNPPQAAKLISKVFVPAIAAPLIEEWLFRGLLLGLWLRFARPIVACIGTSLVFAFLHFLKLPDGAVIADPTHVLAGFELMGKILLHFSDPLFFVTDFASLFVAGLILGWARISTHALWFSIGLHSGWVAVFKLFNQLYEAVSDHMLRPWGVGESLRVGLLPLLTLGITAMACYWVMRRFTPSSQ